MGDSQRRLERLCSGEAAGGDEVVLDGELVCSCSDAFGGGEKAVGIEERGVVGARDAGWCPGEEGDDALPKVDHGAPAAACRREGYRCPADGARLRSPLYHCVSTVKGRAFSRGPHLE